MPLRLDQRDADFETRFRAFLTEKRETEADVVDAVKAILSDVRERGDAALIEYTTKFDRFPLTLETLRVSAEEIEACKKQVDPKTLSALETAYERIKAFHERQRPEDLDFIDEDGVGLGYRWTSVGAAGLYVPGGTAAYPSSVLMNAVPAKVAGVPRLVMVVPTPDGVINPLVMTAADLAGVDEVYRVGGAQAVGALAYGTETIQPVDKIVGPGNAYVAAAKREVFGTVGIDMIAGPSEILVLADGKNDPSWIAADLLSQAEHDTAAQAIMITDDAAFADDVIKAVDAHLKTLPRTEIAQKSWDDFGAVILTEDLKSALPLVDRIAPEHLEIAADDAEDLAAGIRNAGAMFIGRHAPEAIGDYVAGPNHVLPTARSARFSSGLGVLDFMTRTCRIRCDADWLRRIGPAAKTLADAEGLGAHALSVSIRLNLPGE